MGQQKTFENLKAYVDDFELIAQGPPKRDGGDTAFFEGIYYSLMRWLGYMPEDQDPVHGGTLRSSYRKMTDKLHRNGIWRRHSDSEMWYRTFQNFTRDQSRPIIISLGEMGETKILLLTIFKHFFGSFKYRGLHIPRMGLWMTNTKHNWQYPTKKEHNRKNPDPTIKWNYKDKWPDFTFLEYWSLYIRALHKTGFIMPFMILFFLIYIVSLDDIFLYVGGFPFMVIMAGDFISLLKTTYKALLYKGNDDGNRILTLLDSKYNLPTPFSWLANVVYFKNRNYKMILKEYFDPEKRNNPPLGDLFLLVIEGK